jgi:hypothetical protein
MSFRIALALGAANIVWHLALLCAAHYTDRWIEFSEWYFRCAVICPPLFTLFTCAAILFRTKSCWTAGVYCVGGAIALSIAHYLLILAAAGSA